MNSKKNWFYELLGEGIISTCYYFCMTNVNGFGKFKKSGFEKFLISWFGCHSYPSYIMYLILII